MPYIGAMGTWIARVAAVAALVIGGAAVYMAAHPALPGASSSASGGSSNGPSGGQSGGHHKGGHKQPTGMVLGLSTHNLNPPTGYRWMTVTTSWAGHAAGGSTEIVTAGASAKTPARGALVVRIVNAHTGHVVSTQVVHRSGSGKLTITRRLGAGTLAVKDAHGHGYALQISTAKLTPRG